MLSYLRFVILILDVSLIGGGKLWLTMTHPAPLNLLSLPIFGVEALSLEQYNPIPTERPGFLSEHNHLCKITPLQIPKLIMLPQEVQKRKFVAFLGHRDSSELQNGALEAFTPQSDGAAEWLLIGPRIHETSSS